MVKELNQQEGFNYQKTFAPIAKLAIVCFLLAIATVQKWPLIQMDKNNAFLYGGLHEEMHMVPLLGLCQ